MLNMEDILLKSKMSSRSSLKFFEVRDLHILNVNKSVICQFLLLNVYKLLVNWTETRVYIVDRYKPATSASEKQFNC